MSSLKLTKSKIRAGVWEGIVTGSGDTTPKIVAFHETRPVPGITFERGEDNVWILRLPIPPEAVSEGVQTIVIQEEATGEQLGHVTLLAGETMADDLRAEIDLMRAELDLLKRAFRRHCVETA